MPRIIADSIACLDQKEAEEDAIRVIPLSFYFQGKVYHDWVDISPQEAYKLFLEDPDSFKSSAISPAEYLEAFREETQKGNDVVCITLSSKISAGYKAALAAREMLKDIPNRIEVFDSETVSAAEGFIVREAARAAKAGKGTDKVLKVAREMKEKVGFIVLLDTVRHVYRTGRVPRIASQVGGVLNIKPILTVSSGTLHPVGIVRSHGQGIERMIRLMREKVDSGPVHIAVVHAYAEDAAEELAQTVKEEFGAVEVWTSEFSPLMGYSTGTGTLGLAFYKE